MLGVTHSECVQRFTSRGVDPGRQNILEIVASPGCDVIVALSQQLQQLLLIVVSFVLIDIHNDGSSTGVQQSR